MHFVGDPVPVTSGAMPVKVLLSFVLSDLKKAFLFFISLASLSFLYPP